MLKEVTTSQHNKPVDTLSQLLHLDYCTTDKDCLILQNMVETQIRFDRLKMHLFDHSE